MENLTQKYGAVKPNVPPSPLEGYRVVVFEKKQRGTLFKAILNPGDAPIKKEFRFFSEIPDYICYAISSDPNLNFCFDMQITLAALYQYFFLTCTVYYYLSSPKPMALAFETDPLLRIQEELKKRLQENVLVSKLQMQDIKEYFFQIKDKILSYPTLNQLRDFAGEFGVIIKEINMTYKIPEKYLVPELEKEDYFLKTKTEFIEEKERLKKQRREKEDKNHTLELNGIETHHTQNMKDLESFHEYRRQMANMLKEGIGKIVENIDNPESFKKAVDTSIEAVKRVVGEIQYQGGALTEKQLTRTPNGVKVLTAPGPGSFDESNQWLLKIRSIIENTSIPLDDKKIIFSTLNHLQEEIQLEEKADREMVKKYVEKLSDYVNKYSKILTHDIVDHTRKFKEKFNQLVNRSSETSTGTDSQDKATFGI